jgi:hypothetical protein
MISRKGAAGVRLARIDPPGDNEEFDRNNLLFHAVQKKRFGSSTCFLCGRRLGSRNRADEHVIPVWLQDRFKLWNEQLNLLNRTSIPYRQLTIPCCRDCNNEHLSQIEAKVSQAVLSGPSAVRALDEKTLFLWLAKIFYGLLAKEVFLKADRSKARSRRIVPRFLLKRYDLHHSFLQAARFPMKFHRGVPASILVVPLQVPAEPDLQFDFRDSYQLMTISIRLGSVGIIAALQDGRAIRNWGLEWFDKYTAAPLHPLQFIELTARFFYMSSRQNYTPSFILGGSPEKVDVIQMPRSTLRPPFDTWEPPEYANTLSEFTGLPLSTIFTPPDLVHTWLQHPDGAPARLTFEEQPWP